MVGAEHLAGDPQRIADINANRATVGFIPRKNR